MVESVQSYRTSDGGLWPTKADALAHEIETLLTHHASDGHLSTRQVGLLLAHKPKLRSDLRNILKEFD
jgi:hypothetical protein